MSESKVTPIRQDRAENSIMQIIVIAAISIVTAAGMLVMPNLFHGLRIDALKSDMQAIAYSQDYSFALDGKYIDNDQQDLMVSGEMGIKFMPSEGVRLGINLRLGGYLIIGQTKSLPALHEISTGNQIRSGVAGTYLYKDSRCEHIWVGTNEYGVIPDQDNSCTTPKPVPPSIDDLKPISENTGAPKLKLYTHSTPSEAPPGMQWVWE